LGERGQALRRGLGENDAFHQFSVQWVARQELLQVRQHGLGRCLRVGRSRRQGLFGGSVSLGGRLLVLALGLGLHRLALSHRRRRLVLIDLEEGHLLWLVDFRQGLSDFGLQGSERGGVFGLELAAGLIEGRGRRCLRFFGRHGG